jgi:hypothetical protein
MNRDFDEKYPITISLFGYPNIAILYFGILTSQRKKTRMAL